MSHIAPPKPKPCKTCGTCPTCGKVAATKPKPGYVGFPRPYWIGGNTDSVWS